MRAPSWRYRAAVLSRLLAALVGSYALASALAACAGVHLQQLGWPRAETALAGSITALLLLPAVMMGCFACRRAHQAWLGSVAPAALLGALAWAPRWMAAGAA